MTYNNYANYETFAVILIISNDRDLQEGWRNRAAHIRKHARKADQVKSGIWTKEEAARYILADELKESHESRADDSELPEPFSSLLSASLSDVNWAELADELLEEV